MWQDICLSTVLSQAHALPHWWEAVQLHMEGLWKSLQGVVNSAESRANPQRGETVCLRDLQQELSSEGFISCPQKVSSQNIINHSEIKDNFYLDRVSPEMEFRIHTGVLPYTCTACGKKFRYKVRKAILHFFSLALLQNICLYVSCRWPRGPTGVEDLGWTLSRTVSEESWRRRGLTSQGKI